ncbi:MAG: hypothetical protein AAF703_17780 [Cyanobacteria bacterium P01_D01_bin.105]
MSQSIDIAIAFLGGTIISVKGGYRVLQHPKKEHVFNRLADARWFLAIQWCDRFPVPAGILNHDGQLTFQNRAVLAVGETLFLPLSMRKGIFNGCLTLAPGECATYTVNNADPADDHQIDVMGIEIDPRYGKVALVKTQHSEMLAPF